MAITSDPTYGEDVEYSVDKPGTLDHLLAQAYEAGVRHEKQMALMPNGGDAPNFTEWRRSL